MPTILLWNLIVHCYEQNKELLIMPQLTCNSSLAHLCMRAWNSFILLSITSFAAAGLAWQLCKLQEAAQTPATMPNMP